MSSSTLRALASDPQAPNTIASVFIEYDGPLLGRRRSLVQAPTSGVRPVESREDSEGQQTFSYL
jgi:hypothetical protein